jgi:hypothetical protein
MNECVNAACAAQHKTPEAFQKKTAGTLNQGFKRRPRGEKMTKKIIVLALSIISGGMLVGCMTVGYGSKGTGQYHNVQKTREVQAGTRTVYDVTINVGSLPVNSKVRIPLDNGQVTVISGPTGSAKTEGFRGTIGGEAQNPTQAKRMFTYTNAYYAQQAVNAVRAEGGIANILERQIPVTQNEQYTVTEEIRETDYSKPMAQINTWGTVIYVAATALAVYSFAGMPGGDIRIFGENGDTNYGIYALVGVGFSIPLLFDIYSTIAHKKGRIGSYGPIEYVVHKPLKEIQSGNE